MRGVEPDEVLEREADAAEGDGEAGRAAGRELGRDAGAAEAGEELRRADGVEQRDGGQVARLPAARRGR